jgi:hypothetical protein
MEGNRFHDPETPPPIDLGTIHPVFHRQASDETISQISLDEKKKDGKEFDERIDTSDVVTTSSSLDEPSTVHQRRVSHTDQALHLVDTVTRNNNRRRPSKAGILSNLLKLEMFEEKNRRQQQGSSSSSRPQRPTHQLKSIASSRALLQTIGASPQSARNSMYFEDLHKAELGIASDASVAANRMAIASEIADILQRQDLIIKMGKSLVRTGAPSHRIVSLKYAYMSCSFY